MAAVPTNATAQAPSEVRARARHTCPACGAEATWNPARQALGCGFCGTLVPGKLEDGSAGKVV